MIKAVMFATFACAHLLTASAVVEDPYVRTPLGPWTMVCEKANDECVLAQARVAKDSPHPVTINVELSSVGDKVAFKIKTSPIFQPRVRLRFENQRVMFSEKRECEDWGCEFAIDLDRDEVREMEKMKFVEIMVAVTEDEGLAMVFELGDLRAALRHLPLPL